MAPTARRPLNSFTLPPLEIITAERGADFPPLSVRTFLSAAVHQPTFKPIAQLSQTAK